MENHEPLMELLKAYGEHICDIKQNVKFYYCNEIPEKILNNALSSYGKGVSKDAVIGLIDTDLLSTLGLPLFSQGMLFTTAGIYYKGFIHPNFNLKYKDIDSIQISNPSNRWEDNEKVINIKLKDKNVSVKIDDLGFNKEPLFEFLQGAKYLSEKNLTSGTDSVEEFERCVETDIPEEYKSKCRDVIRFHAIISGFIGAGLAQIPTSDTLLITPTQCLMIVRVGNVFNIRIGESAAKGLISSIGTAFVARKFSQMAIGWYPGWGNVINAITAYKLTSFIGWKAAEHFYSIKCEEDSKIKQAVDTLSKPYMDIFQEQAESVEKNKRSMEQKWYEYEKIIKEKDDIIEELIKENEKDNFNLNI